MPLTPDCLAVTVSSDRFSILYGINDESDDNCLYVITTVGPSTTVCVFIISCNCILEQV
jgi:hypothetical protein